MAETVVEEYRSSLSDLTFNSKPLISMLTMLAEDNEQYAADIVQVIEDHIQKAKSTEKLPALYLIDSIIKNMPKSSYLVKFLNNLVTIFAGVFEKVDEKTRGSMYKLRQTWNEIMPNKKLYALDSRVQTIDPAWPITAKQEESPVASIHVNPKFLMKQQEDANSKEQEDQEALMRQQLLAKQQELLKLQQERLELELAEAKARVESQTKQFETATPEDEGQPAASGEQRSASVLPPVEPVVTAPAPATGSPATIPTIAVQGKVRDPRMARDPRLARVSGTSSKESTPPPGRTSSPIPTPSTSSSKPSTAPVKSSSSRHNEKSRNRDLDLRSSSRGKVSSSASSSSSSSSASRKSTTPPRTKDEKRDDSKKRSSDPRSRNGRNDRNSSSTSSRSGQRSYKRHSSRSRSTSPVRDRKSTGSGSRSRSRSPRRSPRSAEKRERSHPWDQKEIGSEGKRRKSPEPSQSIDLTDDTGLERPPEQLEDGAPPAKKSKSEQEEGEASSLPADFRELFGCQDQDYRRPPTSVSSFPPTPGTPDGVSTGRWAQFKAKRPEEFPFAQPRPMLDLPSPSGKPQDVDMRAMTVRRSSTSEPIITSPVPISPEQLNIDIPAPLMLGKLDSVLSEADSQLRSGRLTHEQHQSLLRQLGELQKIQKVKQEMSISREGPEFGVAPTPAAVGIEDRLSPCAGMVVPTDTDARVPPTEQPQPFPDRPLDPPEPERNSGPIDPRSSRPKPSDPRQAARASLPPPPMPPVSMAPSRPGYDQEGQRGRNLPALPRPPLPPHMSSTGRGGRPRSDRFVPHLVGGKYSLPYDTEKYYIPEHDPRWVTLANEGNRHKIYIDDRAFELPLGCPPRSIRLGTGSVEVSVDTHTKGIKLDGVCYYRIGDPAKEITMNGRVCKISYQGPEKKIWIDDQAYEVNTDGPPQAIMIGGVRHMIQIDSIMNQVLVNDRVVCPFGGPKKQIEIGYQKHEVQFEPPPRKILIDGTLCEMNFKGKYPCVNMKGVDYGIRFDGPPREISINDKPWTVPMDAPRKARCATERQHVLAFGGPGHEVIINGQWYEVKFNGPEKTIHLGSKSCTVRLKGPPPEVKILGEIVKDPVRIRELIGDSYIDPSVAVLSSPRMLYMENDGDVPYTHTQRYNDRKANTMPARPPMRGGRPPRGPDMGYQRGHPSDHHRGPPRGLPPHMDDRGRGSPRYDEGRNSPNMDHHRNSPDMDVPSLLKMDIDPPPAPPAAITESSSRPEPPPRNDGPARRDPPPRGDGPPMAHRRYDNAPWRGKSRFDGPMRDMPPHDGLGMHDRRGMRDGMHDLPPHEGPMRDRLDRHELSRMPYGLPPHRGYRGHRFRGQRGQLPPLPPMGYPDDGFYPPPMLPPGAQPLPPNMRRPELPPGYNQFMPPPPSSQPPGGMDLSAHLPSQIDVNSLFDKLISSGIIKKSDEASPAAPNPQVPGSSSSTDKPAVSGPKQPNKPAPSADSQGGKDKEIPLPIIPMVKEKLEDIPDMTNFNIEKMKKSHPGVIQRMYSGIQCSSCGVRFLTEDMERYREHLDWHFRQNKRDKDGVKMAKFRPWYYTTNEWIQFEEISDLEERSHSAYFEGLLQSNPTPGGNMQTVDTPISCPAATGEAGDDVCDMCGEQFENFFDEETEEWRLRDAVRYGGKTYHPSCYEDVQETSLAETPTSESEDAPTVDPMTNPLAFLSKLTATTVKQESTDSTDTTETTAEAAETQSQIKVEPAEVKTEPGTEANSSGSPSPGNPSPENPSPGNPPVTTVIKEEPSS